MGGGGTSFFGSAVDEAAVQADKVNHMIIFAILAVVAAGLKLKNYSSSTLKTSKEFEAFQRKYLIVILL